MNETESGIVIVKLKNGTELVGDLVAVYPTQIELTAPLMINYQVLPGYKFPIVSFKQFIMFAEDGTRVPLEKRDIATLVPARKSFASFYMSSLKTTNMKSFDKVFDEIVDENTPEVEKSDEEKQKAKEARNARLLEAFDVTGEKPN